MNKKVWSHLYELGMEYCRQEPWKRFTDNVLIAVPMADGETAYCAIYGYAEELFGITVYFGEEGLNCLRRIHYSWKVGRDETAAIQQQNCLAMFLGDRDEVGEEQYNIIRELGLKFRGKGAWLYFEAYRKHYTPVCLNDDQAEVLSEALQRFLEALRLLPDKEIRDSRMDLLILEYVPSDDGGQIKERTLSGESYPVDESGRILPDREFALKKAARKKNRMVLETGVFYTESLIRDENKEYFHGRIAVLADHSSGQILEYQVLTPQQSAGQELTDLLGNWIENNGLPSKLYVPDTVHLERLKQPSRFLGLSMQVEPVTAIWRFIAGIQGAHAHGDEFSGEVNTPLEREIMEQLLVEALGIFGLNMEDLKKRAGRMSEKELQAYMKDIVLRKLTEGGLAEALGLSEKDIDEFARGEGDVVEKLLGMLSAVDVDDEDWDWMDEDDDEDWDWDDEEWEDDLVWNEPKSRKEKENAVRIFFDEGASSEDMEDDEESWNFYEYCVWFGETDLSWEELLMEGTKAELQKQARAAGVNVPAKAGKKELAEAITGALRPQKGQSTALRKRLKEIVGEEAMKLVQHIRTKVNSSINSGTECGEEFASFRYSKETVLEAVRWGLIDVRCGWDDEIDILELSILHELM